MSLRFEQVSFESIRADVRAHVNALTGRFDSFVEHHISTSNHYLLRSDLYDRVASIGMFTIEKFRGQGVGAATIRGLIRVTQSRGLEPIAGCWYYNHLSKKTLDCAGMYAASRLLRVEY